MGGNSVLDLEVTRGTMIRGLGSYQRPKQRSNVKLRIAAKVIVIVQGPIVKPNQHL